MPSPTTGQARPSSLPQTIPPQTAEFGLVIDSRTGQPTGKVVIDINWWLYLFNIGKQVLSAPGSPVPLPPIYNIAEFSSSDVDPVDATQSSRMIANAVQLESQDIELSSPESASLSLRINNALLSDLDVASTDAIATKQAIVNALAWLLTEQNINPIIELSADVTGVLQLNHGGTGDGTTFSWTGGTSKTLIANTIESDGASSSALHLITPTAAASQNSNGVAIRTGDAGSSAVGVGQITISTGASNGSGDGGAILVSTGAESVNGFESGSIQFSTGNNTGNFITGHILFQTGNTTSGNAGNIDLTGGTASTSGAGGAINLVCGSSTSGAAGDFTVTAGQSVSGPGGATGIGNINLNVGFSGTKTGLISLFNSFSNAVVQVTDDGVHSGGELGFFAATPINQPTTSFAAATFTQNSGNAVNDASTFDGYTIKQVVKALRSLGLLT